MKYNDSYIAKLNITVTGTGDKHTGFTLTGLTLSLNRCPEIILRGFFTFRWQGNSLMNCRLFGFLAERLSNIPDHKISGSNRFYPDCLQRYIENVNKKQALLAPATCTMINGLHKRVMAFFASCEHFRYSKRFDSWNENISILTSYMGGDYRSWRKVQ